MQPCGFRQLSLLFYLINQAKRLGREVMSQAVAGKYFVVIFW